MLLPGGDGQTANTKTEAAVSGLGAILALQANIMILGEIGDRFHRANDRSNG